MGWYAKAQKLIYEMIYVSLKIFDDFIFKKKSTGILQLRNFADNAYQSLHLNMLRATTLRLEGDFDLYAKTANALQLKKIDHSAYQDLYLRGMRAKVYNIADGTVTDLVNGDTTPNVAQTSLLRTVNTNPTTITQFDGAVPGQMIVIYFTDANTTITHGTNIYLSGGANKTFADKQTLVLMLFDFATDLWIQIGGEI